MKRQSRSSDEELERWPAAEAECLSDCTLKGDVLVLEFPDGTRREVIRHEEFMSGKVTMDFLDAPSSEMLRRRPSSG